MWSTDSMESLTRSNGFLCLGANLEKLFETAMQCNVEGEMQLREVSLVKWEE